MTENTITTSYKPDPLRIHVDAMELAKMQDEIEYYTNVIKTDTEYMRFETAIDNQYAKAEQLGKMLMIHLRDSNFDPRTIPDDTIKFFIESFNEFNGKQKELRDAQRDRVKELKEKFNQEKICTNG